MPISSAGSENFDAETLRRRGRRREGHGSSLRFSPRLRVSASRGVTLLEMLIVVGIIGLIAAVAAPSVASGIDSVRMTSATGSVASFLNAALNRAERRQTAVEVVVAAKENTLRAWSAEPGYQRELKLPDGITIESDSARILLMPGDTAPGIAIQLGNSHGSHRRVRLDPMTGFPHVESVKTE